MRSEGSVKPAIRQGELLEKLRTQIVRGKLAPGARLPIRSRLKQRHGVSNDTIQRAFDNLIRDGFVHSEGSRGTFVSENPPHLCRYALVFPSRPDGAEGWTDWWTTLQQSAAAVVRAEPPKQIVSYYDINGHADVEDYQRLVADVRARRLAGMILLTAPHYLLNTPLLDDCPVPRAYIGCDLWKWNIPGVALDLHSFIDRAIGYAADRSRRRPMLIGLDSDIDLNWLLWSTACRKHGIEAAPWQMLSLPLAPARAARHLTQVLMMLPPERRPDTLVVSDDHFVEEVTAGLLALNLPESELPMVIAHCNFPNPPRALLPVTFLGYNSVGVVRAAIDLLDAQRRGELRSRIDVIDMQRRGQIPTGPNIIPAIFDFERIANDGESSAGRPSGARSAAAGEKIAPHPFYFDLEKR